MSKKLIDYTPDEQDKIRFFRRLHNQITKKYKTPENHLTYKKINSIRYKVLHDGLTQKQLLEFYENKMFDSKNKRNHSIKWYLRIYNFIKNCTPEVWQDVTKSIEYMDTRPTD